MKKLLLAGICTLFVLGGCGRGISSKDVSKALADRPFSAKAVLVWHDRTYESQIIRTQQDGFCVIAASDALKIPVSFVQSQGGCVFTQGALALSMPVDEVPASGLASMMVQGLSRLSEAPQIRQNGQVIVRSVPFEMVLDEKTLAFITLSMQQGEIQFTDFAFLN
jgi:hypothetical protein